jgi:ECF transporter S component (folate family)
MKNIFKFPKFTVYKLCALSMLVAITAILAIFCTFRVGEAIKIPMKFISVFVASALFGPWLGGLCGALGDLINVFLVPSGAPLPLLTVLEFFVGFVYGVFFYNRTQNSKSYIFRCILCAVIIFLSDIILSTAVLLGAGYFPDFMSAIIIRLPAGIIKAIIQLVFFIFSNRFITMLKRVGGLKNE